MTKPVVPRRRAEDDLADAVVYLRDEAGPDVAEGFVAAWEKAVGQLAAFPAAGSPGLGYELGIPGLRSWSIKRYRRLVVYIERTDYVDVIRVLHAASDLAAHLDAPGQRQEEMADDGA